MNYFIDTNIIIDIFNKKIDSSFQNLLKDENNSFFINRLVLIESLRTIPLKNTKIYKEAKLTLDSFEQVDITPKIYDDSIKFSRFFKSKHLALKGKCEAIDLIHFITSKQYKLNPISNDGDFITLESVYIEYKEKNNIC